MPRAGTAVPRIRFIEPSYYWPGQNDDHPPHTTVAAEALLAEVYNALRSNRPSGSLRSWSLFTTSMADSTTMFRHPPPHLPTVIPSRASPLTVSAFVSLPFWSRRGLAEP